MPNILLCRFEYLWWWYVRSYRYHLPIDSVDLMLWSDVSIYVGTYRYYCTLLVRALRIWHALPYGALTSSTLSSIVILFECGRVGARFHLWSRFHCYEHPPRCMVLYMDTSTLFISLVLVRVRDTLCDIHAGFCSFVLSQYVNFHLFIYLFIIIFDTSTYVDSLIYAQSTTIWLVGNIPYGTQIELAETSKSRVDRILDRDGFAHRTHPVGFCLRVLFSIIIVH